MPKKQIPTAWYAISELAPENGIKRKAIHAKIGMDGRYYAYVTATRGYGKLARSHGGASSWEDRRIAICFAYRNAIRQLLPQQANSKERLAYTSNQQDELEREYRDAGADHPATSSTFNIYRHRKDIDDDCRNHAIPRRDRQMVSTASAHAPEG